MSDEELVKRLRDEHLAMTRNEAADRIEDLTDQLAKAVDLAKEAIETMVSGPFYPEEEERRLLSKLAEIEGEKHE
jgi:hypothetical protein